MSECCEAAVVRPGDTVILRCSRSLDDDEAEDLKRRFRNRIPGVDVRVLGGVDQLAVYRPDEHKDTTYHVHMADGATVEDLERAERRRQRQSRKPCPAEKIQPTDGARFRCRLTAGHESEHDFEDMPCGIFPPPSGTVRPALSLFDYSHLPPHLQQASRPFAEVAKLLAATLPEGGEADVALRKLLEGKDAAVRALVEAARV